MSLKNDSKWIDYETFNIENLWFYNEFKKLKESNVDFFNLDSESFQTKLFMKKNKKFNVKKYFNFI